MSWKSSLESMNATRSLMTGTFDRSGRTRRFDATVITSVPSPMLIYDQQTTGLGSSSTLQMLSPRALNGNSLINDSLGLLEKTKAFGSVQSGENKADLGDNFATENKERLVTTHIPLFSWSLHEPRWEDTLRYVAHAPHQSTFVCLPKNSTISNHGTTYQVLSIPATNWVKNKARNNIMAEIDDADPNGVNFTMQRFNLMYGEAKTDREHTGRPDEPRESRGHYFCRPGGINMLNIEASLENLKADSEQNHLATLMESGKFQIVNWWCYSKYSGKIGAKLWYHLVPIYRVNHDNGDVRMYAAWMPKITNRTMDWDNNHFDRDFVHYYVGQIQNEMATGRKRSLRNTETLQLDHDAELFRLLTLNSIPLDNVTIESRLQRRMDYGVLESNKIGSTTRNPTVSELQSVDDYWKLWQEAVTSLCGFVVVEGESRLYITKETRQYWQESDIKRTEAEKILKDIIALKKQYQGSLQAAAGKQDLIDTYSVTLQVLDEQQHNITRALYERFDLEQIQEIASSADRARLIDERVKIIQKERTESASEEALSTSSSSSSLEKKTRDSGISGISGNMDVDISAISYTPTPLPSSSSSSSSSFSSSSETPHRKKNKKQRDVRHD